MAAAELVVAFYRELKEPGVSRAVALQRAQQSLIGELRFRHPASFEQYVLERKGDRLVWKGRHPRSRPMTEAVSPRQVKCTRPPSSVSGVASTSAERASTAA